VSTHKYTNHATSTNAAASSLRVTMLPHQGVMIAAQYTTHGISVILNPVQTKFLANQLLGKLVKLPEGISIT